MIIIGACVSGKFDDLMPNHQELKFPRVHEYIFGRVISSIRDNKYKIQLDDGTYRKVFSSSIMLEDESAGDITS